MAASLTDQIFDGLVRLIIETNMKPGDRLPSENELGERFGVSRNTVRTAINKLNVLGFAETRHGGGTFVKKMGGDAYLNFFIPAALTESGDIMDVLEFRKGIEVQAARLAAERADPEDMAELREIYGQSVANINDMEKFALYNTMFHARIAKASHNRMFDKMMDIIRSIILSEMQDFQAAQQEDIDSDFYHSMILACISNKKPDEAALFMEKHLEGVIDRVKQFRQKEYH